MLFGESFRAADVVVVRVEAGADGAPAIERDAAATTEHGQRHAWRAEVEAHGRAVAEVFDADAHGLRDTVRMNSIVDTTRAAGVGAWWPLASGHGAARMAVSASGRVT